MTYMYYQILGFVDPLLHPFTNCKYQYTQSVLKQNHRKMYQQIVVTLKLLFFIVHPFFSYTLTHEYVIKLHSTNFIGYIHNHQEYTV